MIQLPLSNIAKLTSISVRFCHMSLCAPVVLFPDRNRFFLFFFLTNLLGGSLLATTAAASTHIKTMPCQCRNTKSEAERERE